MAANIVENRAEREWASKGVRGALRSILQEWRRFGLFRQ